VKLSADHGSIRRDEADLIHRVFDLGDTPVSKLMTARGDIHSLPLDATWEDMVSRARASKFSRLPVHLGTLDNVRGVLLTKDLLRHRFTGVVPSRADLVALLKPAYFVPPGKAAGELLREFQRKRHHMAVVLDEFGTVQGLVTMQDILSALFRPVSATGQEHRGPRAERLADGVFRVPARLEIEEWNRQLHPPLPTGETWSTVAGYIFHLFGRLPQKGEQVADEAWTFTVSGMTGTRVTQVTAARRAPKPPRAAR
jgi:CBS domain containing-hemolysin-like protein